MIYIYTQDETYGPYEEEHIERWLQTGEVTPEVLACRAGDEEWVALSALTHGTTRRGISLGMDRLGAIIPKDLTTWLNTFGALIHRHWVRILSAATIGIVSVVVLANADSGFGLVVAGPVLLGGLVSLIGVAPISRAINRWDSRMARLEEWAGTRTGRFSRFFLRPLASGSRWLWKLTASIDNDHARAGVRLTGATLFWGAMIAGLIMVAYMVFIIVMLIVFLMLALWILGAMSGAGSGSSGAARGTSWKKRLSNSRIVDEGLLGDRPTGYKVNDRGELCEEGLFGNRPTGLKVDDDGNIKKDGMLFDQHTGKRINEEGQIVEEGTFFDSPSGKKIDEEGRVVEEGLFFDRRTGKRFKKD